MARAALLHLIRSQSTTFRSAGHRFATVVPQAYASHVKAGHRFATVVPQAHASHIRADANFTKQFSVAREQWSPRATSAQDDNNKISIGPHKGRDEGNEEKDSGFVYYGPISNTIKKVKLLSLSTCCLSVSLGPVITFMTSPDMNVILKGAVASTVIFLSATTTGALHWFVSPYVHKLRWQPGSDSFEVEMMSWLATFLPRTIKFEDIRPPETNRPYVSFKANGNFYFVDAEHCHNKALLAKLTPKDRGPVFKNV